MLVLETLPHDSAPGGKAITLNAIFGWPAKEDFEGLRDNAEFVEAMKPVLAIALPLRKEDSFHLCLHELEE